MIHNLVFLNSFHKQYQVKTSPLLQFSSSTRKLWSLSFLKFRMLRLFKKIDNYN